MMERLWAILQRWAVPVMMTLAYALLAATSETNNVGKAWMSLGLVLVFIVWFMFRALTENAALARALHVGDVAKLLQLADRHLARKRRPADRARFLVGRAFADQLRGDFASALATVEASAPGPELQPLAAAIRIGALVELGRPAADARPHLIAAPRAPALAWLAEGEVAWRDEQRDLAAALFTRIIDDVRAGSATRAIAHLYAARIAADPVVAARHRTAAAALATPEATWLRGAAPI